MPVYLKLAKNPDRLQARIAGIPDKQVFKDTLIRVKSIPGRRPGRDEKDRFVWELPADPETALRVMNMLEPVADSAIQAMVREHQAAVAESLVTPIGHDARLTHPALNHCLFPYQRAYVDWAQTHPRSILGDEMGVGKTIQTYGVWREAQARYDTGQGGPLSEGQRDLPLLVICPNHLRGNWEDELRHGPREEDGAVIYPEWPTATTQILNGANIGKRTQQLKADVEAFVVNWEKLRSDADLLAKRQWGAVIASEAYAAKNPEAQQTKGLWKLNAPLLLPESGTVIANHPGEIWSLLRWLLPEQYARHHAGGGYWPFYYSYVDDYVAKKQHIIRGIKNADQLRFELSDKYVRRTKKQVLPDLPEKLPPKFVPVELNRAERKLYEEAQTALFLDAVNFARERASQEAAEDAQEGLAAGASVEERTAAIAEELAAMPLTTLQRTIPNGGARIAALRQITAWAKARVAAKLIEENYETPLVTFTWFVDPARWLADQFEHRGGRIGVIAGDADASAVSKAFQQGEYDHVVCTIAKAKGFDLYRSHHANFADRDWVPANNHQALDRLHRQGQKSDVSSNILEVPDSVDTGKVAPANRFKQAMHDELFGVA